MITDAQNDTLASQAVISLAPNPLTDDLVTGARREFKFAFMNADVHKLSTILETNAQRIVFGNSEVSHVNSIYFDDQQFTSCQESLAGISLRTKVRLRWYDQPIACDDIFFEIKFRNGQFTRKQRVAMYTSKPLDGSYPPTHYK